MDLCELSFPSGGADGANLSVRYFEIHEGLSTLFEVAVVAMSPSATIDFEGLVGQPARFALHGGDLGQRSFTGIVFGAELLDVEEGGLSTYRVTIVPRAWLLTQRTNHRIFQHLSAPEIATALLTPWDVEVENRFVRGRFPKLEYRVQYGETDFAFLSRILEQAGIHYLFEDVNGTCRFVMCDAPEMAQATGEPLPYVDNPAEGGRAAYVTGLSLSTQVRPGKTVLRDFDFRRPDYALAYKHEAPGPGEGMLEVYRYTPGLGRINVDSSPEDSPVSDSRSAARIDEHEGYALAERRLAGGRSERRHVAFTSNDLSLAAGKAFSIRNHPKAAFAEGRRLIVSSLHLEGTSDGSWDLAANALFADAPIRPEQKTTKPIVSGPQSAIVVGPAGEEIHTDEFGRVRVRFPWDREGKFDDTSTCWLRVADGWAGTGWGMSAIPRVGHEVVVDFFEGDLDEPVVVGRLYDTTQPPPYSLPNKRTKTGWKSQSTPHAEGYNEISFDDALEHETFSIRAEKDLHKTVLNDERDNVLRDKTLMVGGNFTNTVKEVDSIVAGAVHSVQMGKVTKAESVGDGGMADVALGETKREMIPERITISTGGATIQLDGPNVVITAQSDILLKAGGELKILGGPYVQLNPPHVAKSAEIAKAPPEPNEVVWFKLTSEDGAPVPDVVCYAEHESGEESSALRTDGHGLVRFAAPKEGEYKLVVGKPSPKVQAKMDALAQKPAARGTGASGQTNAPAQASASAATPAPAPAPPPANETTKSRGVEVGTTPTQKTPLAKPTGHQVPLVLDVVLPQPQTAFEIHPGAHPAPDPSMPKVTLQANVTFQGQPLTTGTLHWEFSISGKYRVRDGSKKDGYRMQSYTFIAGHTQTEPGQKLDFHLSAGEIVGGDLTVKVTYLGGPELGDLKATKVVNGLKVVGKNPLKDDVRALVKEIGGTQTWCLIRMFCHESAHTLGQFKKGDVLYGPPAGVGIVQRDPEGDEWVWPSNRLTQPNNFFPRIFWDWKKNVREGVERFRSDYMARARREFAALRKAHPHLPEPSEELILRSAIRHYNGGNEYQASADGRHYVVKPYLSKAKDGTLKPLAAGRLPYVNQVLDEPHTDAATYPVPANVRAEIWPPRR